MSAAWILIPSLVSLRDEFNKLAPQRDKTSDGSVGDTAHSNSSSDHNPDESGNTPSEDADRTNEVHAIDVDRDLRLPDITMEDCVQTIVRRHRSGLDDRLQYVIFNRRIWSASRGWAQHPYTGGNPHDHHAHFSARYTTAQENSTKGWGLLALAKKENPMDWSDDVIPNPAWRFDAATNKTVRATFAIGDTWTQAHNAMVKAAAAEKKMDEVLAQLETIKALLTQRATSAE